MSVISEKFSKEYQRFVDWFPLTEYKLFDKNGNQVELKKVDISGYEEPSRNKLETYIKYVMKNFLLSKDGEEITDIKLLAKQFREHKPKRSRSKSSCDDLDGNVKNKKQKIEMGEKTKKIAKKDEKSDEKVVEESFEVIVNSDFDTSDTFYIDTLPYWTRELVKCFGTPMEFNNEDYKYEWRVMVGSKIFSIYNWLNDENEFDNFEECEWYLGGNSSNTSEQKFLMNFINSKQKILESFEKSNIQKDLDEREDLDEDLKEKMYEGGDLNENLEEDLDESIDLEENIENDRDSMIDIELDLIDDEDLEINIDDIEF